MFSKWKAVLRSRLDATIRRLGYVKADDLILTETLIKPLESRLAALENLRAPIRDVITYAMKSHWHVVDSAEPKPSDADISLCPLCGHEGDRPFSKLVSSCIFQGGQLVRHQCPDCGVIFGPQKMMSLDDELLDLEYRVLYHVYSESDSTESAIRTFHLLEPKLGGLYLDFGCGGAWSGAIEALRADGWNIIGFEPSVKVGSEHVLSSWDEIGRLKFDGIISHNVLEHLFDPVETNRRLAALLNDGGKIIHATPCFDYKYEFSRFHVFFFTGKSPEVLAQKTGMKIDRWERDGDFVACIMSQSGA